MQDEAIATIKTGPLVAGLLGAMLSMRAIAEAPLLSRITSMIFATGASVFISPAISEFFELSSAMHNAVSFFIGLLILNFTAGLIDLSRRFAHNPTESMGDLIGLAFRWRTGEPKKTNYKNNNEGE